MFTFSNDLEKYATLGHSIVFPALQFLLYTGIKKIYLVGCDGGWADPGCAQEGDGHLIYWWRKYKMFIEEYIGEESIITVCRVIHDHLGCTAIVMAEDELPCNSDTPHITIGTAEGIKPVYSNTLIVNYLGGYDDIFSADMSFDVDVRV